MGTDVGWCRTLPLYWTDSMTDFVITILFSGHAHYKDNTAENYLFSGF